MNLGAATKHDLGVAFAATDRVLDRPDDNSINVRPHDWSTNSVAGLRVHCRKLVELHVFEQLFQQLGHMEVTADAVSGR